MPRRTVIIVYAEFTRDEFTKCDEYGIVKSTKPSNARAAWSDGWKGVPRYVRAIFIVRRARA
jgi:hypothetical protein